MVCGSLRRSLLSFIRTFFPPNEELGLIPYVYLAKVQQLHCEIERLLQHVENSLGSFFELFSFFMQLINENPNLFDECDKQITIAPVKKNEHLRQLRMKERILLWHI